MGGLVSTRKSFFLSHAGPNKGVALCLARLLHTHGLGYWLDVLDLESAPRDGIYRAIEQAQCFVIVASREYGRRDWCMQEKGYAEGRRKDILCLRIERPPDSASSARSVQGEASPLRVYFQQYPGTSTRGLGGVSVSDEISELFSRLLRIDLTDREREELDSWLDYFGGVDVSRLEYNTMKSFVKDGSLPGDIGSDYEQLSDVDDDETARLLQESSSLQPGDNSGEKSSRESIAVGLLLAGVVLLAFVVAGMLVNECRQLPQIHIGFDGSEALGANGFGVVYRDLDGAEKHPFQIFADHDYKWGRVRVMVNPDGRYGLFQDKEYVLKTVAALKAHGMKVLLDFHYSSWHANQVNQWIPPDWRATDAGDVDATELRGLVYNHTTEVIASLWNQSTLPDAVQIGNEITNGMLWPTCRLNVTDDSDSNWSTLADLTSTARNAVHHVLNDKMSKDKMPKIVIHLATGGDANETLYWLHRFTAADYPRGHCSDCIFGLSYYPMWMAGGLDQLQATLRGLEESFPTNDVWIVETGFFWEKNTDSPQVPVEFENSPEGQFKFLVALRSVMEEHSRRSGRDTAIFYMGSHWTQQELWMKVNETWDLSQRSLFDDDAIALPAIDALMPRMGSLRDICSKTMW